MNKIKIFLLFFAIVSNAQAESFKETYALYERGDYKKSAVIFEKMCTNSHAKACNTLAIMYLAAQGVEQSFEKAAHYSDKACKLKDMHGCANLASMYLSGMGVKQDYKRGKALFDKACKAGDSLSCDRLQMLP